MQCLTSLKTLDLSDVTVKEENLGAGLSRPPYLAKLVLQETMTDPQLLMKIVQFQTSLTHLDLSRYKLQLAYWIYFSIPTTSSVSPKQPPVHRQAEGPLIQEYLVQGSCI